MSNLIITLDQQRTPLTDDIVIRVPASTQETEIRVALADVRGRNRARISVARISVRAPERVIVDRAKVAQAKAREGGR